MHEVSVRRPVIPHLDDRDILPQAVQVDACFGSDMAASDDDHLLSQRGGILMQRLQPYDLSAGHAFLDTGNRRDDLVRSDCYHYHIGLHRGSLLRSQRMPQMHFDALACEPALEDLYEVEHILLKRHVLLRAQRAAERRRLLIQADAVPALRRRDRRLHAADAAADHDDLLRRGRGRSLEALELVPHHRVKRAAERAVRQVVIEAGVAPAAAVDVVRMPGKRLLGEVRVADRLARQLDQVRLPARDDLFHLVRVIQTAQRRDRGLHVLFDLFGQIDVASVVAEHRGMRDREHVVVLVDAGRNVKDVDLSVERLRHLDAVLKAVAALNHLGAAHTELDRVVPADLADLLDHEQREAHAVLERAAPAVGPMVHARGHELVQQPAVAAVDQDHVEADVLAELRGVREAVRDALDVFLGHRLHGQSLGVHLVVRAVDVRDRVLAVAARARVLSAVRELHDRQAVMPVQVVHDFLQRGIAHDVVELHFLRVRAAVGIDDAQAQAHRRKSAASAVLMKRDIFLPHAAVGIHLGTRHGSAENAVLKGQVPYSEGAGQVRIILVFHLDLLLCSQGQCRRAVYHCRPFSVSFFFSVLKNVRVRNETLRRRTLPSKKELPHRSAAAPFLFRSLQTSAGFTHPLPGPCGPCTRSC